MNYIFFALIFMGAFSAEASEKKKPLRVAIPYSLAAPLLIMNKGEPTGIVRDYTDAISKRIGMRFEYVVVPKFRIHEMMKRGYTQINCYTNPNWMTDAKDYIWSKMIFQKNEVIATKKKTATTLESLRGQRVGTVVLYLYPLLDTRFQKKELIREDAPTEELNLQKFINGRIDNIVIEEIQLSYWLKKNPKAQISYQTIPVQRYPIHCQINAEETKLLALFDKAITEINSSDDLKKIFARYK